MRRIGRLTERWQRALPLEDRSHVDKEQPEVDYRVIEVAPELLLLFLLTFTRGAVLQRGEPSGLASGPTSLALEPRLAAFLADFSSFELAPAPPRPRPDLVLVEKLLLMR